MNRLTRFLGMVLLALPLLQCSDEKPESPFVPSVETFEVTLTGPTTVDVTGDTDFCMFTVSATASGDYGQRVAWVGNHAPEMTDLVTGEVVTEYWVNEWLDAAGAPVTSIGLGETQTHQIVGYNAKRNSYKLRLSWPHGFPRTSPAEHTVECHHLIAR